MKVGIVDCGNSNILSVVRALNKVGNAEIELCTNPKDVRGISAIILPGVGSFPDGMKRLRKTGLDEAIKEQASQGTKLLGICLGMQLLSTRGHEFFETAGLEIIDGEVTKLCKQKSSDEVFTVPYVGWAEINMIASTERSIFDEFHKKSFYFVHSYEFITHKLFDTAFSYKYINQDITAIVKKDNVIGTQFHPEKSGENGLKFLQNFLEWKV